MDSNALKLAVNYAWNDAHNDGHWYGEMRTNATITAEYVMLYQALGLEKSLEREALSQWLLTVQNPDGSWSIAPKYPGDVSTTTEAYFALKLLGISTKNPAMQRACSFVRASGGIARVRIFTRIYLATFGLFPWEAIPQLPAELILMPPWAPISIYSFSSWARSTIVPLLVVIHHQPFYNLPDGESTDYLDELWCDPSNKMVPYSEPLTNAVNTEKVALVFTLIDKILYQLGGLRYFPLRGYSRRQCIQWILDRQEPAGDWAGIFPPMHLGILALKLEGYSMSDSRITRALEAIERFAWYGADGKHIQACVSPVWDTALMSIALIDAGTPTNDERLIKSIQWIKDRQLVGPEGDWRIYQPNITAGGFSFEYHNSWYPDIDDTAAIIIAFLKQDPNAASSDHVIRAVQWTLGMQNKDGGWAAFDYENNKLFLNKIPFSDMDSLSDPSTADVTGRVLEAFGLLREISNKFNTPKALSFQHNNLNKANKNIPEALLKRVEQACDRAINYLAATQEPNGCWYGRWGCNYIYGTSNVLCALAYFHPTTHPEVSLLIDSAISWLKSVQNPTDGGFGECLDSYRDPTLAGRGASSTASQTAWGAMGLLAHLEKSDECVERCVGFLISTQMRTEMREGGGGEGEGGVDGGAGAGERATWDEEEYTGTGFPNHFYLGYSYYSHYFPLMALGRYCGVENKG